MHIDLRVIGQPRGVHPAGHADRVAPDVVLRLPRPDDPGHDGAGVDAHAQHEVVVRVLVDVAQFVSHAEHELDQLEMEKNRIQK